MANEQQTEMALALTKLANAAKGYKHPNYKHTVEVDKLCYELTTGEGLEEHVKQFIGREAKSNWEARKTALKSIVPVVYNELTDPQYQVPRSNNAVRVLGYIGDNDKQLVELEKVLQGFNGKQGVDEWMATRWVDLNNEAPNAWVVLEWAEFDNTKERAQPYPFEVYADQVVDYWAVQNNVQYIIVKTSRTITIAQREFVLPVFTFYGKWQTVVLTERHDNELLPTGATAHKVEDKNYYYTAPTPHMLGFVPAFRPGYKGDKRTRTATYVSPIDRAIPVLRKLLDADSEYEFTRACHVFPKEYRYDPQCDNRGCNGGRMADGSQCPICKGTGFLGATDHDNTGSVVKIALPKNPDPLQIIDLARMVHYATPPIELLNVMRAHIADLKVECQTALYGSEIYTRDEIAQTATAKNIDLQKLNNALYQMALNWANDWEWLTKSIAAITELNKGLICSYRFGKDLKLKSLDTLYLDLKTASQSGAALFIKNAIENDIARIMYAEDNRELVKQSVMQWFDPFSGKSEAERTMLMAGDLVPKRTKVFAANFMTVFKELEYEQQMAGVDFYAMPRNRQIELVDAKVAELMATLPAPEPNLFAAPVNNNPNDNDTPENE